MGAHAPHLWRSLGFAPARTALRLRPGSPFAALFARVRALRLDQELADGVAPWHSCVHAARALQVTSDRARNRLAQSLERLIGEAEAGSGHDTPLSARVGPCHQQIVLARDEMLLLVDRLRTPAPIDAGAAVRLRRLLHDGAGPFYKPCGPLALRESLDSLVDALGVPD
jgi:hypothetical protein